MKIDLNRYIQNNKYEGQHEESIEIIKLKETHDQSINKKTNFTI